MFAQSEIVLLKRNVFSCLLSEIWHAWQAADCSRSVEQHVKRLYPSEYVACITEPAAEASAECSTRVGWCHTRRSVKYDATKPWRLRNINNRSLYSVHCLIRSQWRSI